MKRILLAISLLKVFFVQGQITGSLIVRGDIDKYYPVAFADGGHPNNVATVLDLGRSSVHLDSEWRGSIIASFRYHVTNWGNASHFIDADLRQHRHDFAPTPFVAGWRDATYGNSNTRIIIWLKGGSTTYYYKSNYAVYPVVHDGVQNLLPLQEPNGPAHSFKTAVDDYVNSRGINVDGGVYAYREAINYFAGNVGIGTAKPSEKLSVNGNIVARKVTVTNNGWADFVFDNDYQLRSLQQVEKYIQQHKHLPDVPSAKNVLQNGLDLGSSQAVLLQKIEELTLYSIQQDKEITQLKAQLQKQHELLQEISKKLDLKKP